MSSSFPLFMTATRDESSISINVCKERLYPNLSSVTTPASTDDTEPTASSEPTGGSIRSLNSLSASDDNFGMESLLEGIHSQLNLNFNETTGIDDVDAGSTNGNGAGSANRVIGRQDGTAGAALLWGSSSTSSSPTWGIIGDGGGGSVTASSIPVSTSVGSGLNHVLAHPTPVSSGTRNGGVFKKSTVGFEPSAKGIIAPPPGGSFSSSMSSAFRHDVSESRLEADYVGNTNILPALVSSKERVEVEGDSALMRPHQQQGGIPVVHNAGCTPEDIPMNAASQLSHQQKENMLHPSYVYRDFPLYENGGMVAHSRMMSSPGLINAMGGHMPHSGHAVAMNSHASYLQQQHELHVQQLSYFPSGQDGIMDGHGFVGTHAFSSQASEARHAPNTVRSPPLAYGSSAGMRDGVGKEKKRHGHGLPSPRSRQVHPAPVVSSSASRYQHQEHLTMPVAMKESDRQHLLSGYFHAHQQDSYEYHMASRQGQIVMAREQPPQLEEAMMYRPNLELMAQGMAPHMAMMGASSAVRDSHIPCFSPHAVSNQRSQAAHSGVPISYSQSGGGVQSVHSSGDGANVTQHLLPPRHQSSRAPCSAPPGSMGCATREISSGGSVGSVSSNSGKNNLGLGSQQRHPPLSQLVGKIRRMSRDQVGCRLLQHALSEEGPPAATAILRELLPNLGDLMMDPFGNYLFQKLLDVLSEDERIVLVESVSGKLVAAALNLHGTRSVQKIVDVASAAAGTDVVSFTSPASESDENGCYKLASMVSAALQPAAARLCIDSHGNHVIQRILLGFPPSHSEFVFHCVARNVSEVARHRHGCCVIQRCLDAGLRNVVEAESGSEDGSDVGNEAELDQDIVPLEGDDKSPMAKARSLLIGKICECALELMQDAYGNYVVQYVLDVCVDTPHYHTHVVNSICRVTLHKVAKLSIQKFSSNVIEKCLEKCSEQMRELLLKEIMHPKSIATIMQDPFGNYVVQRALSVATHAQAVRLVESMKSHLGLMNVRNTAGGRRIMEKICKRFPNFNLDTGVSSTMVGVSGGAAGTIGQMRKGGTARCEEYMEYKEDDKMYEEYPVKERARKSKKEASRMVKVG